MPQCRLPNALGGLKRDEVASSADDTAPEVKKN
jgi:hypothetical protein